VGEKILVILDFDGVLVDPMPRLYAIHKDLFEEYGATPLDYEEYRDLKRKPVKESEFVTPLLGENTEEYLQRRLELIETQEYLSQDKLFDFSIDCLKRLKEKHTIVLWTARSNKKELHKEIEEKQIADFFDQVIVSEEKEEKLDVIPGFDPSNSIIVGDTEVEVRIAQEHKIKCIAVNSGMRRKAVLEMLKPDYLVENLKEAIDQGLL
tara:strand:- start:2393 stop:3016 length:624 start_codon:yes stop_codon:yes gene_type:complete